MQLQKRKNKWVMVMNQLFSISTKKIKGKVELSIEDNGNGIPQKVADIIFQPFFTTKPTGQGTGLSLSMSYNIIKAHSGAISVESTEGEGTRFIIQLPIAGKIIYYVRISCQGSAFQI